MDSTTLAENYVKLMLIENKEDAKDFVQQRILNNMLHSPLFDAHDFRFPASRYVEGLNQVHEQHLRNQLAGNHNGIMSFILNGWRAHAPFQKRLSILYTAMAEPHLWQRIWIDTRYDLSITQEDINAQAKKEHLETIDNAPFTPEQEAMLHWLLVRETYRWENVDRETGEITTLNTGLCFLVEKETNREPFLRPGQKPYTPPSQQ